MMSMEYEGGNANRGGGVDVGHQTLGSYVHLQEDLSPQNLKCLPPIPGFFSNLCTNASCVREMQEKLSLSFMHYHFDVVWYSLFTKVKELL